MDHRHYKKCLVCGVKEKTIAGSTGRIKFYMVPAKEYKRNLWLTNINRKDLINQIISKDVRICEMHFTSNMVNPETGRLRLNALPSPVVIKTEVEAELAYPENENTSQILGTSNKEVVRYTVLQGAESGLPTTAATTTCELSNPVDERTSKLAAPMDKVKINSKKEVFRYTVLQSVESRLPLTSATNTHELSIPLDEGTSQLVTAMDKVKTTSKKLKTLDKEVANSKNEVANLSNELRNWKSEVANLQNEVTHLQNELRNSKDEVANLQNEVRNSKNEVANLQNEVTNLQNELRNSKDEVANLQNEVRNSKNEVANLQNQVKLYQEEDFVLKKCKDMSTNLSRIVENELRNIGHDRNGYRFSTEMKQFSLSLHSISPSAYSFLSKTITLPNERTLITFKKKFPSGSGN